jgi:FAD/FMN-containing dehydrogenase
MIGLFFISLLASLVIATPEKPSCRCRPHEACWPSNQEWSNFNKTIQGNLITVRPIAAVCHEPEFDEAACKTIKEDWTDSLWRAAQPGAVQWENWEAWPEHNQSCYIESAQNTRCGQGRISLYSAKVQTSSQIQKAVVFAQTHNLRLVIRNSGHDYIGRSTAPESLQIFTHGMNDITFVDDFVPAGAPEGKVEGFAVTMAAGVHLSELYETAGANSRTVQGGASHTVGAAGGFIQAGGHSPFGARGGLASDNALEFQVVTADVSELHKQVKHITNNGLGQTCHCERVPK